MARFARLIIYDAPPKEMTSQIAQSLAEGIHNKGDVTITVINLADSTMLNGFIATEEEHLNEFISSN